MFMAEQQKKRPFHETIVDATERVENAEQLAFLAPLIAETKIPKNHDTIVAVWDSKREELGLEDNELLFGVRAAVLRQKEEAEEEAAKNAKKAEGVGSSTA